MRASFSGQARISIRTRQALPGPAETRYSKLCPDAASEARPEESVPNMQEARMQEAKPPRPRMRGPQVGKAAMEGAEIDPASVRRSHPVPIPYPLLEPPPDRTEA